MDSGPPQHDDLVAERPQRHVHAHRAQQRPRPWPGGDDHEPRLCPAAIGNDSRHASAGNLYAGDVRSRNHPRAHLAGAVRVPGRDRIRIGIAGAGLVRDRLVAAHRQDRLHPLGVTRRHHIGVDADNLLHRDVGLQGQPLLIPGDQEVSGLHESGRGADHIFEAAEHLKALPRHAGGHLVRVVHPQNGLGAAGGPRSQGFPFEEHGPVQPACSEVIQDAAAHDAAADYHGVGC